MKSFCHKIIFLECMILYVLLLTNVLSSQGAPLVSALWHAGSQDIRDPYRELPGKVALTFDDGPHPAYTEKLLDGLKERGVQATFFVTGDHARLHPELILRMHEEGHLIGNHTYSHLQLKSGNREEFREELVQTNQVIEAITGEKVQYVRPPYGSWDKSFEMELAMFPVLWDVDPLDWCKGDADCIAQSVVEKVGEGDIVLMHDYYGSSVDAALEIVDILLDRGYEFVTVDKLILE